MPAIKKGNNHGAKRDAAAKHKQRADRDGDLVMGAAPRTNDRVGKNNRGNNRGGPARNAPRGPANKFNPEQLQREVLKHVNGRSGPANPPKNVKAPGEQRVFLISGFKDSKASGNQDGGVGSLVSFIERKATTYLKKKFNRRDPVKIKKYIVKDDDTIQITVADNEAGAIRSLNGWLFTNKNITVEDITGTEDTDRLSDLEKTFKDMLARRYNAETKLLDLSNLGQDPDLVAAGIFNVTQTSSKFFPALMKTCNFLFKASERKEKFLSISLANNELESIKTVTSLASTFPDIKNLDLSNNKLADFKAFDGWERKFKDLDFLVVSGNPVEQIPDFHLEFMKWFRKLRFLNGQQVRTDEEAASVNVFKSSVPIKGPNFQDEGGIGQTFITNFIAGFDTDRAALVNMYYDEKSQFSYDVNGRAPKDKSTTTTKQEWDAWIKGSRNFKAITTLSARVTRLHFGTEDITKAFATLPATMHASLVTEPTKWSIDCVSSPSVPDPSGQYPQGVQGLLVTLHGEFTEVDPATGQPGKPRSFDRVFTLGPGCATGVRVVNDCLTVRGYGGSDAWQPEDAPAVALTPDQIILELSRLTGMKPDYSKLCLDESGWDPEQALANFEKARATLPAEAFAGVGVGG